MDSGIYTRANAALASDKEKKSERYFPGFTSITGRRLCVRDGEDTEKEYGEEEGRKQYERDRRAR